MLNRLALATILAVVTLGQFRVSSAYAEDGWIRPPGPVATLGSAHTYLLTGQRQANGACHFQYPEVRLSLGEIEIAGQDVAVDPVRCLKLVQQGIPGADFFAGAVGNQATAIASGAGVLPLISGIASGYVNVWWQDLFTIKVNGDKTSIAWNYDGHCAGSGSTSGEWSWNYGSGWELVSHSASELEQCLRYRGQSVSHMRNVPFCYPVMVDTYYYYVTAYGYEDGTISGTWSSDTLNECLPLFMKYDVKKTV